MVARDMKTTCNLDVIKTYTTMAETKKHAISSVYEAKHVDALAEICFLLASSEKSLRDRAF